MEKARNALSERDVPLVCVHCLNSKIAQGGDEKMRG